MKLRKRLRQGPESLMALLAWIVIPYLPRRAVVALAHGLGALAWRFSRKLQRISEANLDLAFGGELPLARRQAIGRAAFQSFALTLLDVYWFRRNRRRRLERYVRMTPACMPLIHASPLIAVTGHIGNWEIMSTVCGLHDVPVTAVAMPLANGMADRLLNRLRRTTGSRAVARQGAVRPLLKSLKAGRTIALVIDQNTLPEEGGVWVPFFGLPVPVSNAAGMLWQRTGVQLITLACRADRNGMYTMSGSVLFPEEANSGITAEAITRRASAMLEEEIRAQPEQWLWAYKRWRYYRTEDPAERYPFYAKHYTPGSRRRPKRPKETRE